MLLIVAPQIQQLEEELRLAALLTDKVRQY